MNERLFELLKTKAASLGFSEAELKTVAESLSKSLDQKEGAEQNDETLLGLISMAMPSLELGQKAANRIVAKKQKEFEEKLQTALQTTKPTEKEPVQTNDTTAAKETQPSNELGELKDLFKAFMEQTNKRFDILDGQRVSQTRKQQLEAIVKGNEQFGGRYMRDFDRINFKDDEDFTNWLNEAKTEIETYNNERKMSGFPNKPKIGGNVDETNKKDVITDAQIDQLASSF